MTQIDDLTERLASLEDTLANLGLGDLPVKQIQDKLEQDWQPNAQSLLGSNSITPTMLNFDVLQLAVAGQLALDVFVANATLTWPGATTVSNTITVNHNLGRAPQLVLPVIVNAPNPFSVIACFNFTTTTFQARGNFETFAPANTRTDQFRWIAIG